MTSKPASAATAASNAAVRAELPFHDTTDFDLATRGLIARASGQIRDGSGTVVWDLDKWAFLDGDAAER